MIGEGGREIGERGRVGMGRKPSPFLLIGVLSTKDCHWATKTQKWVPKSRTGRWFLKESGKNHKGATKCTSRWLCLLRSVRSCTKSLAHQTWAEKRGYVHHHGNREAKEDDRVANFDSFVQKKTNSSSFLRKRVRALLSAFPFLRRPLWREKKYYVTNKEKRKIYWNAVMVGMFFALLSLLSLAGSSFPFSFPFSFSFSFSSMAFSFSLFLLYPPT